MELLAFSDTIPAFWTSYFIHIYDNVCIWGNVEPAQAIQN